MWDSIVFAAFDELNPVLATRARPIDLELLRVTLAALLVAVVIVQMGRLLWLRHDFGRALVLTGLATFVFHWLAFCATNIPLPLARTGIFFVPIAILVAGLGSALSPTARARTRRPVRRHRRALPLRRLLRRMPCGSRISRNGDSTRRRRMPLSPWPGNERDHPLGTVAAIGDTPTP
jgi:hypothetical protein